MTKLPIIDPEFKALIPPLSSDEQAQLEQNILDARKCRDAIILWEGIIIDGHHRFGICMEHGIEFEIKEKPFASRDEAMLWALENQLARRNLNEAARIELVLLKEYVMRKKARKKQSRAGGDKTSGKNEGALLSEMTSQNEPGYDVQKAQAVKAGVSQGNLYYYLDIKKNGSPALLEKVRSGEIKIGTAYRLLPKQILKELRIADKMYKSIGEHMPFITNETAKAQVHAGLEKLAAQLRIFINMPEELSTVSERTENHGPTKNQS